MVCCIISYISCRDLIKLFLLCNFRYFVFNSPVTTCKKFLTKLRLPLRKITVLETVEVLMIVDAQTVSQNKKRQSKPNFGLTHYKQVNKAVKIS